MYERMNSVRAVGNIECLSQLHSHTLVKCITVQLRLERSKLTVSHFLTAHSSYITSLPASRLIKVKTGR